MRETRKPGLAASLRGLLEGGLQVAQTRLSLLSVEVQEEKLRVTALLLNVVLCAVLLAFGVVFLLAFLTVLFWEEHRLLALGLATAVCIGTGIWTASNAARELRRGSTLFSASLAELSRDRAALRNEE